jgi:heat-inducible transcriptional repressor
MFRNAFFQGSMSNEAPLKTRHHEVLNSIVRAYIETGEPVASRTIAKRRGDALSPASVRNVMADLADEGFLSQPHTSAGRVPTEKAFRYYVSSLTASRIMAHEAERLRNQFTALHSIGACMERSSQLLMELTRNVGIAAVIPRVSQELDQVELVSLGDRRVLVILVTRDHVVRNRVVALDQPFTPEDLVSSRNYINRNFAGWQLGEVRRELLRRMAEERALYDQVMLNLQQLYSKGLFEVDNSPEVHMEGASNLLGLDLHLTREKMRELLRALEEKRRVIELLDRFLEHPPGELEVLVGLEEVHPAMKDLALIGMNIRMGGGVPARVAVLGPIRMHYERVMAAVLETSRALESALF